MQNYNPYQQQFKPMGFKVIPISNEYEVNNITVDFNGTPTYFHNQNLNEIYVKQFDIKTGLTTTQKYIKSDSAGHETNMINPQTGQNIYEEKLNTINDRLDGLKELIEKSGSKK